MAAPAWKARKQVEALKLVHDAIVVAQMPSHNYEAEGDRRRCTPRCPVQAAAAGAQSDPPFTKLDTCLP